MSEKSKTRYFFFAACFRVNGITTMCEFGINRNYFPTWAYLKEYICLQKKCDKDSIVILSLCEWPEEDFNTFFVEELKTVSDLH